MGAGASRNWKLRHVLTTGGYGLDAEVEILLDERTRIEGNITREGNKYVRFAFISFIGRSYRHIST